MNEQIEMFDQWACRINDKSITTLFDNKRKAWRIQYFNYGSKQAQTVYDDKNQMVEFKTQQDAIDFVFLYFTGSLKVNWVKK